MTTEALHILAGWIGAFLGVLTGAVFGLAFHKENWLHFLRPRSTIDYLVKAAY